MNAAVAVRGMEVGMSKAIDEAKDDARANIEALVKAMGEWGPFDLLAAIDAAYTALENQEVEHEIQVPTSGDVKCPNCGATLTTIVEIERESDPVAEADIDPARGTISDAAAPLYTDNVAWITPCCATRVAVSEKWALNTTY